MNFLSGLFLVLLILKITGFVSLSWGGYLLAYDYKCDYFYCIWFNSRPSFETLQELKNFSSATERTLDFGNIVVEKMKNSLMYYSKKINRNKIDNFLFSFCWHELKNDLLWNYIIKQQYDKEELSIETIDLFDRNMSECFQFVFEKLFKGK